MNAPPATVIQSVIAAIMQLQDDPSLLDKAPWQVERLREADALLWAIIDEDIEES
jgi:hypothetical protein